MGRDTGIIIKNLEVRKMATKKAIPTTNIILYIPGSLGIDDVNKEAIIGYKLGKEIF